MIDRYTIKFGPAVSQKELERAFNTTTPQEVVALVGKMKARIEIVGDFADLKELDGILKQLSNKLTVNAQNEQA